MLFVDWRSEMGPYFYPDTVRAPLVAAGNLTLVDLVSVEPTIGYAIQPQWYELLPPGIDSDDGLF